MNFNHSLTLPFYTGKSVYFLYLIYLPLLILPIIDKALAVGWTSRIMLNADSNFQLLKLEKYPDSQMSAVF